MYTPIYTMQFGKDMRRCVRRGKNMEKFKILARTFLSGRLPDPIHRDHIENVHHVYCYRRLGVSPRNKE